MRVIYCRKFKEGHTKERVFGGRKEIRDKNHGIINISKSYFLEARTFGESKRPLDEEVSGAVQFLSP